jgi:hypothetical protein
MLRTKLLLLTICLPALLLACDDEDTPATPTSPAETPAQTVETAEPSPTTVVEPPADPGWDQSAVWEDYYESPVFSECFPSEDVPTCVADVAEEAGISQTALDFIHQNETALISFEELGLVDYGEVSSPEFNMGRAEPALLNGDFGLRYFGAGIPQDWRTAHPSYEAIEEDASGGGPFPWSEYSALAEATDGPAGQRLVFETVIQECRACATLAFLVLELTFTPDGAQSGVSVLPLRCEPESERFQDVIMAEDGPCS